MGMRAIVAGSAIVIGVIQYIYISALKKLGKNQRQLEEIFMGPEIVVPAAAAPAIQYVVLPASQYPSYANPG